MSNDVITQDYKSERTAYRIDIDALSCRTISIEELQDHIRSQRRLIEERNGEK